MKKKALIFLLMALVTLNSIVCAAPTQNTTTKPTQTQTEENKDKKAEFPKPNAESAIVIDEKSGDIIFALNHDRKVYPAGTSNIMTAIIALENAKLSDICTVSEEALKNVNYDQPQLGMEVGETYTVEQLLYGIIINSNNDCANTLALAVTNTIDEFVAKMNEKAAQLGMTGTHFANPTGWHDENHYTTAEDMAKLAKYAMENPTFAEMVMKQKYVFPPTNMRGSEKTILSTNHLVSRYKYPYHYYPNATGIKSGNSTNAGYCLVASAVKGHLSLISVVMNCPNADAKDGAYSFKDTAKMYDYIFENYQSVLLAKQGDVIYDTKVKEAKDASRLALTVDSDVYVTMKKSADPEIIENVVDVTEEAVAPIAQGDPFGTVVFSYNGKELKTANLVAANEVKRDFILHLINNVFGFIFNPVVILIIILIAAFFIRLRIVRDRKRKIRHSKMASYRRENDRPRTPRDSYSSRNQSDYHRRR